MRVKDTHWPYSEYDVADAEGSLLVSSAQATEVVDPVPFPVPVIEPTTVPLSADPDPVEIAQAQAQEADAATIADVEQTHDELQSIAPLVEPVVEQPVVEQAVVPVVVDTPAETAPVETPVVA